MHRLAGCVCLCIQLPSWDTLACRMRGSWPGALNVTHHRSEGWMFGNAACDCVGCHPSEQRRSLAAVCVFADIQRLCTLTVPFCKGREFGEVTTGSEGQWLTEVGWRGRKRKQSRKVKTRGKIRGTWNGKHVIIWLELQPLTWCLHLGSSDSMTDLGLLRASATEIT